MVSGQWHSGGVCVSSRYLDCRHVTADYVLLDTPIGGIPGGWLAPRGVP